MAETLSITACGPPSVTPPSPLLGPSPHLRILPSDSPRAIGSVFFNPFEVDYTELRRAGTQHKPRTETPRFPGFFPCAPLVLCVFSSSFSAPAPPLPLSLCPFIYYICRSPLRIAYWWRHPHHACFTSPHVKQLTLLPAHFSVFPVSPPRSCLLHAPRF